MSRLAHSWRMVDHIRRCHIRNVRLVVATGPILLIHPLGQLRKCPAFAHSWRMVDHIRRCHIRNVVSRRNRANSVNSPSGPTSKMSRLAHSWRMVDHIRRCHIRNVVSRRNWANYGKH